MNNEEIAYKLIELYYTNKNTFKNYCMSLTDLCEKYNRVLEILKGESE